MSKKATATPLVTLVREDSAEVFLLDTVAKEREVGAPPWHFSIGRDASNCVALPDEDKVSAKHAELEVNRLADGSLTLR